MGIIRMVIRNNVKITFHNIETSKDEVIETHNLVVDNGMESIIQRLAGVDIPANTKGTITYCAVGTGTDAPTANDTKLQTEVERKQITVRTYSGKTATFTSFFSTEEANDTLKELGLFGDDATIIADSGTLFARLSIDRAKTSSETLTIEWQIILASS